tara:strand:- start:1292 stop:2959 length:1668 start_codon:yes stop_codon:yes gene_type:complete
LWFSEIEKFPKAVLAHHYPDVPDLGDFTTKEFMDYARANPVDVFCGGTPCQGFSVAGLRGGLEDDRSNLALQFLRVVGEIRPTWVVWENVPGVFSTESGRDFGAFLGGLAELGYGYGYRTFDAQYFGVPQRRRRVFVVGHLGDWRPAVSVLFERESLLRDLTPSRKKRKGFATDAEASPDERREVFDPLSADGHPRTYGKAGEVTAPSLLTAKGGQRQTCVTDPGVEVSPPLSQRDYKDPGTDGINPESAKMVVASPLDKGGRGTNDRGDGTDNLIVNDRVSGTIDASIGKNQGQDHQHTNEGCPNFVLEKDQQAFSLMPMREGTDYKGRETDVAQPLTTSGTHPGASQGGDCIVEDDRVAGAILKSEHKGPGHNRDQNVVAVSENVRGEVRESDVVGALMGGGGKPGQGYPAVRYVQDVADTVMVKEGATRTNEGNVFRCRNLTAQEKASGFLPTQGSQAQGVGFEEEKSPTLRSGCDTYGMQKGMVVRRLTPRECERLQGFPDDFTRIPWRGKKVEDCPDGPRYAALGNSIAVPVLKWIGERIDEVENNKPKP